ncbi:MAG: undecaprenyl/decaprenyl-phosphate alpha-N-acetylglucosaminyl 1-phosphate transferase [Candidatus Brocadia sp.]|nr:undecaprenyl/decaprenyl-phosphate alpha-N-acetylglucosaminyl 1-phosphate transferase [Candidatus Brocadia sp.]
MAKRFDIIDYPNHRKIHTAPTPLLGGCAIFGAFTIVLSIHLSIVVLLKDAIASNLLLSPRLQFYAHNTTFITKQVLAVILGGLVIAFVGLIDDIKGLSITVRLAVETAVAFFTVWMGFKSYIFLPEVTTWIITIFWIVGVTNAFNLLDGADGLAGGVGVISSCILAGIMFFGNQPLIGMLLLTLAAAIAGFLRYNLPPARIFMGSAGSMFIGYILSVTTILATFTISNASTNYVVALPIVILSMPLYDTFSVIFLRSIKKIPIAKGDLNHLVHRLMRAGFPQRKAVVIIYLMSFIIGMLGVFLIWTTELQSILLLSFIVILFVGIFFFEYFLTKQNHRLLKLKKLSDYSTTNSALSG